MQSQFPIRPILRFVPRAVRLAVLAALVLSIPAAAAAAEAGSITGRVITADGAPVADAVVAVLASGLRVSADADGRFILERVPAGRYLLEVTSVRHGRSTVERVTVRPGETTAVDVLLSSRVHTEQIVVTASTEHRGELDLASPVNVLDGAELALRSEPSLGETLAGLAGVSSTYFAPGASRPVIRGQGGDRVRMMENGLGTGDVSSTSPDHAVALDPLRAERVEVVRGPATLLYGSNAIGGVVNVLDQSIPEYRATGTLSGTVDLRAGSVADERAGAIALDGGGGPWAWHADLLRRRTDDYEIPGRAALEPDEHEGGAEEEGPVGILPNSDLEAVGGGLGVSYFFGAKGTLGVSFRGLDSEYGVPGGEHEEHEEEGEEEHGEEEHGEEGIRIDMKQRRVDLEGALTQTFGAFRGAKFQLGFSDYQHDELEGPGIVGTRFLQDSWEGRVELVQRTRGSHDGSLGIQVSRRDLEAIGEEAFIDPAETSSVGVFTFQEIGAGAVRYQFGLRYESQRNKVDSPGLPDRSFDGLSGALGVVWKPVESYSLGASLARSVKMPNSEELYSSGLHFATSSFELGDPSLDEETALGLDLSLRKTEGRVTGALSLYFNDFSDYIFQRFTGDEVDGFPVLQYSQADATFRGAELELSIGLIERDHSSWHLDLLWDVVRAELDGGEDLPRIPPQRLGAGLHYHSHRLRGGAEVRYVDDQDRVAVNETPTDGFTMVGANLSYRFFFADYILDLILRGTNLTDEEARAHTSFVKDDVPLPGRNVSLIVRFGF